MSRIKYQLSTPFRDFLKYLEDSKRLIYLSIKGIFQISESLDLVKALAELEREKDGTLPDKEIEKINIAEKESIFAKAEIENDFPLLHAHSLVGLWSMFESTLREEAVLIIIKYPKIVFGDKIAEMKIKLSIKDLIEDNEYYKAYSILREIERNLNDASFIERYETLYSSFGIKGAPIKSQEKILIEMQQIRNLIVHKSSVVDEHFMVTCPWVRVKKGEKIIISSKKFSLYLDSVVEYITNLMNRLKDFKTDIEAKKPIRKKRQNIKKYSEKK